jgi:hypothetical protein
MNLVHDLELASLMAMPPVAAAVLILLLSLWERALKAPLPEVELPGSVDHARDYDPFGRWSATTIRAFPQNART